MDFGSIRPVTATPPAPVPRAPAQDDTTIELPRVAVPASGETLEATIGRREPTEERPTKRRVERDEVTDTLVFAKLDAVSGYVVAQVPSEALLKVRAMAEAFGEASIPKPPGVDVTI
jgi:prolyl-tRNA editing enzyme YbaK/EbsC (Cys-tRNA(Pro) deacylase)